MAWQGDGTFTRTNGTNTGTETWQDDAAAGTKILADRHDTHDQDLAAGIAACLTKNGETKSTVDFKPNASGTLDLGSKALKWVIAYLSGGVVLAERSDHAETPAAGYGEIWIKDDTPSSLMYTDDAGTDFNLRALPGSQIQMVNTTDGAVATGTTVLPLDDTIPQNTEGDEYMTLAITPTSATNKLKIDVVCHLAGSSSGATYMAAALFQDSTAGALAAGLAARNNGADNRACVVFTHYMTSGTTSSTTFKVRGGNASAGTTTFNGSAGAREFGGVFASSITITEIQV